MDSSTNKILEMNGVVFSYPTEKIFDNLSFSLSAGEKVGLLGANGSGKTTLLRLTAGLARPYSGDIKLFGNVVSTEDDFAEVRFKIGYLFQDSDDQLFCPTVIDDVCFGLLNKGYSDSDARDIAMRSLNELGIGYLADKITYKLSGGEKRLCAFATIYAMSPDLYLLDEPSSGLDAKTEDMLAGFIAKIPTAMLVVSHNSDFMEKTVSSCLEISAGRLFAADRAVQ